MSEKVEGKLHSIEELAKMPFGTPHTEPALRWICPCGFTNWTKAGPAKCVWCGCEVEVKGNAG